MSQEANGSSSELSSVPTRRGRRGKTMALDIVNMPNGEKIHVCFNKYGQPNSERTASKLSSWIGKLARNSTVLPLTYTDWRLVPQVYKDDAWIQISNKFTVTDDNKDWCIEKLAIRWRDHKSNMKSLHYTKFDTDAERRENIDLTIMSKEAWDVMFKMWGEKKVLDIAERNKNNKSKQLMRHTTGSTPYAVIYEKKKNEHPERLSPTRIDMFEVTHTSKKTGAFIDTESEKNMNALKEKLYEYDEERRQDKEVHEKVFVDVLKKDSHGRVRMMGAGVTPTQVFGKEAMRVMRTDSLVEQLRKENSELKAKIFETEENVSQQGVTISQQGATIAEQGALIVEMQSQMLAFKQFMSSTQSSR